MNEPLTAQWLLDLHSYPHLFIGFSGGLDSTVLVHVLNRHLPDKITAVHINHGLSPYAAEWETHCKNFCEHWELPLIIKKVHCSAAANIEEEARNARYQAFYSILQSHCALVLAHHQNDQAETVLLQLFRGAGVDGLSAMASVKKFARGVLLRPFLAHSRAFLENYARQHELAWIEDDSNLNTQFSRNFLRQQVLPLLESTWPQVVINLARTATHCRDSQSLLMDLAQLDKPDLAGERLCLEGILSLPFLRLANVVRAWLKKNEVRMPQKKIFDRLIREVIFARKDANPRVDWDIYSVRRYQNDLYLLKLSNNASRSFSSALRTPCMQEDGSHSFLWSSFPNPLLLDGVMLEVLPASAGLVVPSGSVIEVRFRKKGDTFVWHKQTKSLKKLFQEWHVPPWQRSQVPLIFCNGSLAAVVGWAISDNFYQSDAVNACEIRVKESTPSIFDEI